MCQSASQIYIFSMYGIYYYVFGWKLGNSRIRNRNACQCEAKRGAPPKQPQCMKLDRCEAVCEKKSIAC